MWQKPRANEQGVKKAPDEYGASIYLEAYRYALDLCDNPAIAREVAARFTKSLEAREPAAAGFEIKQA